MPNKIKDKPIYVFLLFWTILGLLQAYFTELSYDEAYYWLCSQKLAWGYYHHPPGIKLFIAAGYHFLNNELGVRLVTVLLSSTTLFIVYKLIDKPKPFIFIGIVSSILLVHMANFLAVPDTALIFFAALYLYLFKQYIQRNSWITALLLGIVMAAMLYSKYHGVLIIGFSVLATPMLLKRASIWFAFALVMLLFIPHLHWQYTFGFPSFEYYLFSRNLSEFSLNNIFGFLGGQLLVSGPIIGLLILPAAFLYKPADAFQRVLKFCLVGIFSFFLLFSFKGSIEANWTAAAFIPLIILSHNFIAERQLLVKALKNLAPTSFVILLAFRFLLVYDYLPFDTKITNEYHDWDTYAQALKTKAAGKPVVFMNTYQAPSKYAFYTGEFAYSQNNFRSKGNQFDLWHTEETLQGKAVLLMPNYWMNSADTIYRRQRPIACKFIEAFESYNYINIELLNPNTISTAHIAQLKLTNNSSPSILAIGSQPAFIGYVVFKNDSLVLDTRDLQQLESLPDSTIAQRMPIDIATLSQGKYYIRFCITSTNLPPGNNSPFYKLVIQ